ncbi:protocadherin gamma-B2-like [Phyllobates terribilis]|uniref:protocadherin gamma-B2-like n=1 Tax=Phyllobates terribilis TaxID=111132 RepID=UPI003CCB4EC7
MKNATRQSRNKWEQIYQVFSFIFFFITHVYGQLQYSVHEEMKKGSVIGNVAKDLGLNVDEFANRKFQLILKAKIKNLNVNLENGDLFVSDRIDRETLCGNKPNCFINLEAVIENPLNFYTITIEILDVNDNAPIFSKIQFDLEISEVTSPGAHFALGNAQDPDIGTNSIQSYTLSGNENFGLGEKITTDGIKYPEIILEKSLDREKQSYYELILTALDGGNPQKSSTATVRIIVQDFNDNLPMFNQDTYQVRLHEDADIGSLVIHLNATDEDEGSNAEIAYSFSHISDNAHHCFQLIHRVETLK